MTLLCPMNVCYIRFDMLIRTAHPNDLPALVAIYNEQVLNGTATFDTVPVTIEERRAWLLDHNIDNHPLWVAEVDAKAVGYASLSTFNPKQAYASTVELSVYVDVSHRGQGIGRALAQAMIDWARDDARTHRIVSLVTTENTASMHLHERLGFRHVGTLDEAGTKFNRWLSVAFWELSV